MGLLSKLILNALGTFFVLVGIAGIFLPLLPATPFLLLASACYLRGSDRLYAWLINNKYLGPYIRNIRDKRGMPVKAKIYSVIILWASILISVYRLDHVALKVVLLMTAVGVSVLIYKIRTLREEH